MASLYTSCPDKPRPCEILIDARKLGDGGVGVYIENLVYGLLSLAEYQSELWGISLLISPAFLKCQESDCEDLKQLLNDWSASVRFFVEKAQKYSLEEYFILAHRQRKNLTNKALYHSPHYTLPFGLSIPSVTTIHDVIHVSHPDTTLHGVIGKYLIRSAARRSSSLVTVSEASASAIRNIIHPRDTRKLSIIPNAIRHNFQFAKGHCSTEFLENFNIQKSFYFVFIGNNRQHKGFDLLLEAWLLVKQASVSFAKYKLLAIGDKFDSGVKNRIAEIGLTKEIILLSQLSINVIRSLMENAAGVVIASKEEGFGLVALEAIFTGTPLISFPIPSIIEICQSSGWIAHDFSPSSLALEIEKLIKDPYAVDLKCKEGKSLAKRYTLQVFATAMQLVYERAINCQSI